MSDLDALIDDPEPDPITEETSDNPSKISVNTSTQRVLAMIKKSTKELLEETNSKDNKSDKSKDNSFFKLIKLLDEKVDRLDAKINKLYAEEDHNPATAILLDKISKRLDRKSNKDDVKIIDDKVKLLEENIKNENGNSNDNANKEKDDQSNKFDMKHVEGIISNEIATRFSELQGIIDARLELMDEKINNIQKSMFSTMIH